MRISYSIANLRRLISTPQIEIRPITLLLGRNSAGKSTFLRSFPLLRQSVETKASAPILWYGDYVDFGQFHGAVTNNDTDRSIVFSFELSSFSAMMTDYPGIQRGYSQKLIRLENISISYGVKNIGEATGRDKISVKIPSIEANLEIKFDESGNFAKSIKINDEDVLQIFPDIRLYFPQGNAFLNGSFFRVGKDGKFTVESRQDLFIGAIQKELSRYVDGRIGRSTLQAESFRILSKNNIDSDALNSLKNAETKTFRDIYLDMQNGFYGQLRKKLNAICQFNFFFRSIEAVNMQLTTYFRTVEYIGPARARSERFYRQQELEVSEISPDGRNLPMFLASLSPMRLLRFSEWVERLFGYGITVRKTEGHISINLEQSGKSINVVDTGYGVSQVLPVLAQIWWMQQGGRDRRFLPNSGENRKLLAIEQPELHLHPAHQALLADVFAEAITSDGGANSNIAVSFVIETHSESIVNRLGELISEGKISSNDVQVVIFGDSEKNKDEADIQLAAYDDEGLLQNWPYGFFNY